MRFINQAKILLKLIPRYLRQDIQKLFANGRILHKHSRIRPKPKSTELVYNCAVLP